MKILISGSLGNIGRNVIDYLIDKNHELIAIDYKEPLEKVKCTFYKCDLRNKSEIEDVYMKEKNIDVVIHLAALISFDNKKKMELVESNIFGTYNLVYISDLHKVKKIIYISSLPIATPDSFELEENNYKDNPITTYHFTKLIGEKFFLDPGLDLKSVILRIASPVSKSMNRNLFFPKMIDKAIANEQMNIYGKGTRVQNYIHVLDIAQAIEKSMGGNVSGIYFIGGTSISNIDLVKSIIYNIKSNSSINLLESLSVNDDDIIWNISNRKAFRDFNYRPKYSIDSMIDLLSNRIDK